MIEPLSGHDKDKDEEVEEEVEQEVEEEEGEAGGKGADQPDSIGNSLYSKTLSNATISFSSLETFLNPFPMSIVTLRA